MIIDTLLVRAGEIIVTRGSGQETGLSALLQECYRLGDYNTLHTLCRRLSALAVEEHQQRDDLLVACKDIYKALRTRGDQADSAFRNALRAAIANTEKTTP